MENLPKIEQQTNIQDNSRRFENVKEELLDYQLQYVEKLDSGELNFLEGSNNKRDFSELLKDYTLLVHNIEDEFCKRYKDMDNVSRDEFEYQRGFFAGSVIHKVDELYKQDKKQWKEGIKKIVEDKLAELGPQIRELPKNKDEKVGLIHFNIVTTNKLNEFGIADTDNCASIHFEDLFKQKKNDPSLSLFSIRESFSKLALSIVEKHQDIQAVIARSWLVDSAGSTMGFNVYKKHEKVLDNEGFWGQFINEKGELNRERMKKFMETGKAEFYPAEGFIKTEDFLRKYLPKEKRGLVGLKGKTEEAVKFEKEFSLITEKVKSNWMNMSFDEILSVLNSNSDLFDYFKTKDGKEFLVMMKAFKDSGLKTMDDFVYDYKNDINQKFREFVVEKTNQYKYKEVFIPLNS